MNLARVVLGAAMGLVVAGCGRRPSNDAVDTAAMAPAPSAPAVTVIEVREASPGLLAEATFRPTEAQQVALTRWPGGTVIEASIDRSGNDLIYTYRIRDTGGETRTVKINARTGMVVDSMSPQ